MARGTPDYGNYNNVIAVNDADYGDIVAAIQTYLRVDGRGRVLFSDDFKSGVGAWVLSRTPTNRWPFLTTATYKVFSAPVSLSMPIDNVGDNAGISRYIGCFSPSVVGVEVMLNSQADEFDIYILLRFRPVGGTEYVCRVWYDASVELWQVQTSAGWVTVEDWSGMATKPNGWFAVKIVADFVNGTYRRMIIGATEHDLSVQPLNAGAFLAEGEMRLDINVYDGGMGLGDLQIGYIILTADEP